MAVTTQCWEQCFQSLATPQYRPILQEVYKSGNDLKRMKDINSINSVTYLLDATIASFCPEHSDHSSSSSHSFSSSESLENELRRENATAIWQLQLQMMAILTAMMGNVKVVPVQFNENAAWSCVEYSCIDCCTTFALVAGNFLTPVQVNTTSCKDGLLEPSCRVGYHNLQTVAGCTGFKNNLTVAILNSDVHSHVHKRSNYRDYSPCHTFYHYRYALGLHKAKHDDLERFQTDDDAHNFMGDSLLYQTVVNQLFNCMNTKCCATPGTVTPATACNVAYGDAGETLTSVASINPTVG